MIISVFSLVRLLFETENVSKKNIALSQKIRCKCIIYYANDTNSLNIAVHICTIEYKCRFKEIYKIA